MPKVSHYNTLYYPSTRVTWEKITKDPKENILGPMGLADHPSFKLRFVMKTTYNIKHFLKSLTSN